MRVNLTPFAVLGLGAGFTMSTLAVVPMQAVKPAIRTVKMGDKDLEEITGRTRHSTVLVFRGETITKAFGGDAAGSVKGHWLMEFGSEKKPTNIFTLKPTLAGSDSNLTIVTTSKDSEEDRTYSFKLTSCEKCQPDTKVFIEHKGDKPAPDDPHVPQIIALTGKLNSAVEDAATARVAEKEANQKALRADAEADKRVQQFEHDYPLTMRGDYKFKKLAAPFFVNDIWSDKKRTYIQIQGELSSIYTTRDGKPEILQFDFKAAESGDLGTYVIDRVLEDGYLSLGKRTKLKFERVAK